MISVQNVDYYFLIIDNADRFQEKFWIKSNFNGFPRKLNIGFFFGFTVIWIGCR